MVVRELPADLTLSTGIGDIFLKKAVIARIAGGLANQMICYKAARMVASWNNASLILDASPYGFLDGNWHGYLNFQLHHHPILYDCLVFSTNVVERIRACNNVYCVTREMLAPTDSPEEALVVKEVRKASIVFFDFWFASFLRTAVSGHMEPASQGRNEPATEMGKNSHYFSKKLP